jgi:hypothetical protein
MCRVCIEFAERETAAKVSEPYGAIAQLVERFHGMEEVEGSIPSSSTSVLVEALALSYRRTAHVLGGVIAGEGYFTTVRRHPPFKNGEPRQRFVFGMTMASRDEHLLRTLRELLGFGSIHRRAPAKEHGEESSTLMVNSLKAHQAAVIPFCERYLPPTAKRTQFETWRAALTAYDRCHPHRHGKGPSTCSVDDCPMPVRGRGLCRKHYYLATGY